MKRLAISILAVVCLVANAKDKAIQELVLDEQTVFVIPVSVNRVTTISFPGPISAIDAAQATIDPQKPAPFLISYAKGTSFFSVRAEEKKAVTNINIRWNDQTYVLELIENDDPFLSVTFEPPLDNSQVSQPDPVTPTRLLALLDKAKAYPLLKVYHPEALADVEYRDCQNDLRIVDCSNYAVSVKEVFRFNPEDTLVFRIGITNETDKELVYARDGFSVRIGERTYPQSISDASGIVPPHFEAPAYFAITGTPDGERNDISIKSDFYVILNAHTLEPVVPAKQPDTQNQTSPK